MSLAKLYGRRSKNTQIAIADSEKLKKLALAAEAKDLCSMSYFAKTMFFSHNPGPLFNSSTLNFNGLAAAFTYEVMMVGISTEAIDSFTIITSQYIDNLVVY
jgi:hypothetical protein